MILKLRNGFTLAEVLITLGIIGVVAAMTIPTLINKYQKHVYYTQFRKAASQLENAIKMFEIDNGCVGNISDCLPNYSYLTAGDIVKYLNITEKITFQSESYNKYENIYDDFDCAPPLCAFITNDGMFFNPWMDSGTGNGGIVDINGPNKGPNKYGRDIFVYYMPYAGDIYSHELVWGGNEKKVGDSKDWQCNEEDYMVGCATKLFQEGKMNY